MKIYKNKNTGWIAIKHSDMLYSVNYNNTSEFVSLLFIEGSSDWVLQPEQINKNKCTCTMSEKFYCTKKCENSIQPQPKFNSEKPVEQKKIIELLSNTEVEEIVLFWVKCINVDSDILYDLTKDKLYPVLKSYDTVKQYLIIDDCNNKFCYNQSKFEKVELKISESKTEPANTEQKILFYVKCTDSEYISPLTTNKIYPVFKEKDFYYHIKNDFGKIIDYPKFLFDKVEISEPIKNPEVILTTHDGVQITDPEQRVWYVSKNTSILHTMHNECNSDSAEHVLALGKDLIYFSKYEKRCEYIENNQKRFSIADLEAKTLTLEQLDELLVKSDGTFINSVYIIKKVDLK